MAGNGFIVDVILTEANGADASSVVNSSVGTEATARLAADGVLADADAAIIAAEDTRHGTAVLVAGTKVVADTSITADTIILLTCQVPGGTPGWLQVSARTVGQDFTILSSSNTDTSTIGYRKYEPV